MNIVFVKNSQKETFVTAFLYVYFLSYQYLLENMDVGTLPDGGVKLIERLTALEGEVRRQGDKVAAMVVEPGESLSLFLYVGEGSELNPPRCSIGGPRINSPIPREPIAISSI